MPAAHAFISYVHENRELVLRLTEDLRAQGVTVWLDRNDIKPGQFWKDAINEAIQGGAYFIACFSEEFCGRKETFMHGELRLAIDRLRNMPRNQVWFIPVLLNQTKIPSHPISDHENLSDIQAVALFGNWADGVRRILSVIKDDDPAYRRVLHLIDLLRKHPVERLHAIKQLQTISGEHVEVAAAFRKITPVLAKELDHDSEAVRFDAIEGLCAMGQAAWEAVPALVGALSDKDAQIRWRAAAALGSLGPQATAAVPALIVALRDQNDEVRSYAAEALGSIGPTAFEAMPILIGALRDENEGVGARAAEALGAMGPAAFDSAAALAKALRHGSGKIRAKAAEALAKIGPLALSAVPALTDALTDDDPEVREKGAEAIAKILTINGGVSARAVTSLIAGLNDHNDRVRTWAASALESIGPASFEAVPALIEVLGTGDENARSAAASALAAVGPAAAGAIPALVIALRDSDEYVRHRAIGAIGDIVDSSSMPVLLDALVDPDEEFRTAAAKALGRIGPASATAAGSLITLLGGTLFEASAAMEALRGIGPPVIPELIEALGNENGMIRSYAFDILEGIGSPAIPSLAQATTDINERRRRNAARLLARCRGADLEKTLSNIVPNLCSTDKEIRILSAIAIGAIGESAICFLGTALKGLVPSGNSIVASAETANELESLLQVSDERIRAWAALSLGRFGFDAIPILTKILAQEDELARVCAVQALKSCGPAGISILAGALSQTDYFVRWATIVALSNVGPGAVDALPALTKSLNDDECGIQDEVARLLGKIGPAAAESVPFLAKVLTNPAKQGDINLKCTCTNSLVAIGPRSVVALVDAMRATKDELVTPSICSTALANLALEAVPALVQLLRDPDVKLRILAARTLARIGPEAMSAIPGLKAALRDEDTKVCRFAAEALARVDKQFHEIGWELREAKRPTQTTN